MRVSTIFKTQAKNILEESNCSVCDVLVTMIGGALALQL